MTIPVNTHAFHLIKFTQPHVQPGVFRSKIATANKPYLFRNARKAICVVSGHNKLAGLKAALAGGYVTDLILDEPTAHKLVASIGE
ncbi:MAG: hypothetical protein GY805_01960 [Chloroflexi bacterium]|nr:hypothetical protein [Chloroflexota bacterium]